MRELADKEREKVQATDKLKKDMFHKIEETKVISCPNITGLSSSFEEGTDSYNKQANSSIKSLANYRIRVLEQINRKATFQKQQVAGSDFKFKERC